MKKKGQAALEFLTTYGWALILLTIALGAIYVFLDYNPKDLIPESCSFGDSFNCEDFMMNQTSGVVTIVLKNAVGTEINLTGMSCVYEGEKIVDRCEESDCIEENCCIIDPGEKFTVSCDLSETGAALKSKSKVDVTVVYFKKGMSFPSSSDGTISGAIVK